jgi:hypothetical protein
VDGWIGLCEPVPLEHETAGSDPSDLSSSYAGSDPVTQAHPVSNGTGVALRAVIGGCAAAIIHTPSALLTPLLLEGN